MEGDTARDAAISVGVAEADAGFVVGAGRV